MNPKRVFLKATDIENCDIISSLLQDSIFHVSALSFHENRKCLRLVINRFCWELIKDNLETGAKRKHYFRVHSGLYIHNIQSITINDNFKKIKEEKYINLLAMHASEKEINLLFSGHKTACIKIEDICVYLKDLHDKYPTPALPEHK
jgi:hypothetical protein